jgi:hypothetical protein
MEKKIIYGVDISKKITPIMVRDAIIRCFILAHKEILEMMKECYDFESKKEFKKISQLKIKFLIKNIFKEVDGDFDNPSKEILIKVIHKLAEVAKQFRNPKIIKKHYGEIIQLINKLE